MPRPRRLGVDTRAKNHCRACSPPIQFPINPIWHRMEMRCFSAGYEHHQPPTTTAHALQRPRMPSTYPRSTAVFPILADAVEVKTGSRSTAHWSNDFIRLNGWLRNSFAQLITPRDIDGIGQNAVDVTRGDWEDSNTYCSLPTSGRSRQEQLCRTDARQPSIRPDTTSRPIRSCADCRLFLSGSARIRKTAI